MIRARTSGSRALSKAIASVRLDPAVADAPQTGRLLVLFGPPDGGEPRYSLGRAESKTPVVGLDVDRLEPGKAVSTAAASCQFPLGAIDKLPPGAYRTQAVLHTNPDLNIPNAPGDLFSRPVPVTIDPAKRPAESIELVLDQQLPEETLPNDTEWVKSLKLRSSLLSRFHGRDIFLRAAVVLPRGYSEQPERRYPLRVHVGGYGSRFSWAHGRMERGGGFARFWQSNDAPRFLILHVDGAGPLGDPYQIDSANHGPFGAALTTELIPHIERTYRGNGRRVVDGGSTGGWVSFALQVFYPELFLGCWSSCPDPVDFRSFQRVNIYEDSNAYVDGAGREVPSCRDPRSGEVLYTVRQECAMENVLGRGDSWAMSGQQWGAWNATFGPKGADGRPVPLWDPKSGQIDKSVLDYWMKYDLRRYLVANWAELGPRLKGKLRIWIGDADDFYLNEAVHRFDAAVRRLEPKYDGPITYGPGHGHCWSSLGELEQLKEMAAVVGAEA
jgi:hypothetical protein